MSKAKKGVKKGLVPKLRFPEFREAGEWRVNKLGDLFANRQETGFETLPLLSLTEKDGIIPQAESSRKNNASADKSRYLKAMPGDLAYNTMRMWQGRSAYVDQEGIISPAYTVCEPLDSVNGLFFSYYFKTSQLIEQFRRYSQGLVNDTLNLKYAVFSKIPVLTPKSDEQQKIADCLSSLDALIAAQADKLDALNVHKKGLMQRLFPREGETVPELRFPEFRDAGDWEEKELEPYLRIHVERISAADNTLPVYSSTREGLKFQKEYYDGRELVNEGEYGVVPAGYFVYRHMSDDTVFRFNINDTEGRIAVSKEYPVFTTANLDSRFLLYTLNCGLDFQRFAESQRKGGTRTRLYFKTLCKLSTLLPTVPEQHRIADCLSSLDALITTQAEKIETLKTHKKGLMQQLFPSVQEAGGISSGGALTHE